MNRPSIKSPCVADISHGPDERIAEITFPDGTGALLSVRINNDGKKVIELYRADPDIMWFVPKVPGEGKKK